MKVVDPLTRKCEEKKFTEQEIKKLHELIQKISDNDKKLTSELLREFMDFSYGKQMPAHYWKEGLDREVTHKALPAFVPNKRGGYNQGGGGGQYPNKGRGGYQGGGRGGYQGGQKEYSGGGGDSFQKGVA